MLIAPVVNNSGKKGRGVLWKHKYYGKCAVQPKRMREGEREQEAPKGESYGEGDGREQEGTEDDVKVRMLDSMGSEIR